MKLPQMMICGVGDGVSLVITTWKRFGDYWRTKNVDAMRASPSIAFAYEKRGQEDLEYRLPLAPLTNNKIIVRD
jgi:hypothetical protein